MDQSGSRHDRGAEVTPSRFPRRLARPILNLQEVLDDDDEAVGAGPSPSAVSAGGRRAAVRARAASARADGAGDVCRGPQVRLGDARANPQGPAATTSAAWLRGRP